MSDGKDEEGGCERKRRDLIVVRREGMEVYLALTMCVEMGDR